MGASIRSAFIGLVVLCIALTTLVCLALSLTSSDKALSDIKGVRDDSVQSCFQVNEDNVFCSILHSNSNRIHSFRPRFAFLVRKYTKELHNNTLRRVRQRGDGGVTGGVAGVQRFVFTPF
eukprot:TRINITY_DN758_c0_g1_i4.p1 TRINITY_DN758_c0_g1~~TRINITY_DN758_c0_g1_i4.p1  ORF type:complete len:120 (+),score=11.45 TRINITY_DN758_c0_g1_i4:810-1169(+)